MAVLARVPRARAAAVRIHGALLEFLRAALRPVGAHERAAVFGGAAEAVAAFVAGVARPAVGFARIDDPVAAHVAGVELLTGEIKRGMARVLPGSGVHVD